MSKAQIKTLLTIKNCHWHYSSTHKHFCLSSIHTHPLPLFVFFFFFLLKVAIVIADPWFCHSLTFLLLRDYSQGLASAKKYAKTFFIIFCVVKITIFAESFTGPEYHKVMPAVTACNTFCTVIWVVAKTLASCCNTFWHMVVWGRQHPLLEGFLTTFFNPRFSYLLWNLCWHWKPVLVGSLSKQSMHGCQCKELTLPFTH